MRLEVGDRIITNLHLYSGPAKNCTNFKQNKLDVLLVSRKRTSDIPSPTFTCRSLLMSGVAPNQMQKLEYLNLEMQIKKVILFLSWRNAYC